MKTTKFTAAICTHLGGPKQVRLETIEAGPLQKNEVLIDVKAAALNFPDLLMTYGKYQFKPSLPFVVGMEGAGVITAIGRPDCPFQMGDKVMFKGKTGACGYMICVDMDQVLHLPKSLTFEEGAAFSVTFSTAYIALRRRARLKPGEYLLVLGAGGGVGQASIAVGKALGATVIAAASSDEKLEIAKASGADYLIRYDENRFAETVLRITHGQGAGVILDPVGGDLLEESVRSLAWQGRLLTVGFASGSFGHVPLDLLREKGATLVGVRAGEYGRRNPAAGLSAQSELAALTEKHGLKPYIGKSWHFDEVGKALLAMEKRQVTGKQIIKMGDAGD
ncbi:NADPH:quinone oxidoreductase family protein [Sneathiella sp.]|jgi:NADPH2:quinone reductase|uniref:NADPH:quinone oxidoreductase family protein n=1 Tax=Sneathiella sp. TaxID=1964365 RepID=UPI0039E4C796